MDTDNVKSIDHVCDLCYALGLRYEISPNEQDAEEAQQRAETARTYLRDSASPSDILRLENALGMVFLRKYNEKRDPVSLTNCLRSVNSCINCQLDMHAPRAAVPLSRKIIRTMVLALS